MNGWDTVGSGFRRCRLSVSTYVGLRSWRKTLDVGNFEVCLFSRWSRLLASEGGRNWDDRLQRMGDFS